MCSYFLFFVPLLSGEKTSHFHQRDWLNLEHPSRGLGLLDNLLPPSPRWIISRLPRLLYTRSTRVIKQTKKYIINGKWQTFNPSVSMCFIFISCTLLPGSTVEVTLRANSECSSIYYTLLCFIRPAWFIVLRSLGFIWDSLGSKVVQCYIATYTCIIYSSVIYTSSNVFT